MLNFFGPKKVDFLAIGDSAVDVFIKIKDAEVHCKVNNSDCELCMKFASKIPYELSQEVFGTGNAANSSVCLARLGLKTALISNFGNDDVGRKSLMSLKKNGVDISMSSMHDEIKTNVHYVLWYGPERTILTKHEKVKYNMPINAFSNKPNLPEAKWLYLTSLGDGAPQHYYDSIIQYLNNNPKTKLAFQPGSQQIKMGFKKLIDFYRRADILSSTIEEARAILGVDQSIDVHQLFTSLNRLGPKMIIITDGPKGAYLFDGTIPDSIKKYFIPSFPEDKPAYERTGAGDAFTSTFIGALIIGKEPKEAIMWGPINATSVVQKIGAQDGLLSRKEIEDLYYKYSNFSTYRIKEI